MRVSSFVYILVYFVTSFLCIGSTNVWSRLKIHRSSGDTSPHADLENPAAINDYTVTFEPDLPKEICAFDSISIAAVIATDEITSTSLSDQLLLFVEQERTGAAMVRQLIEGGSTLERDMQKNTSASILCVLNSDDCIPQVTSISIRDPNKVPRILLVTFNTETMMTELPNAASLLKALFFNPHLTGE